jgi:hypothetical protein
VWGGLCGTGTPFDSAQGKALFVAFDFDIEISEIKSPTLFQTERKKWGTHNQKQDQIQELDQNHKPGLTAYTPQHRLLRLSIQQSEGAL